MEKKKIEISKHGNYLFGQLDGIDLVESGEMTTTKGELIKYGSSLKFKFILQVEKEKTIMGEKVITNMPITQLVQVAVSDDKLLSEYKKYQDLVGKELLLPYFNADNFKFKIQDISKIQIIK